MYFYYFFWIFLALVRKGRSNWAGIGILWDGCVKPGIVGLFLVSLRGNDPDVSVSLGHRHATPRLAATLTLAVIAGCAASTARQENDGRSAAIVAGSSSTGESLRGGIHDFGTVLAHGQTLHHEFTLKNDSDRPLKILEMRPFMPCCSGMDTQADRVSPGATIRLPVFFKPGTQGGRRLVRFLLRTDSSDRPDRTFALLASVVPEVEIAVLDRSLTTLLLGQSGKLKLRVTCRQSGEYGRAAPVRVRDSDTLHPHILDSGQDLSRNGILMETKRTIEVEIASSSSVGHKQESLVIEWENGREMEFPVTWRVIPCVETMPSALILNSTESMAERQILVSCADRPIRILSVEGSSLAEHARFPEVAADKVVVRLRLASRNASATGTSDILIRTDHPDQPTAIVTVHSMAETAGFP
jgi:hypothetical protein